MQFSNEPSALHSRMISQIVTTMARNSRRLLISEEIVNLGLPECKAEDSLENCILALGHNTSGKIKLHSVYYTAVQLLHRNVATLIMYIPP